MRCRPGVDPRGGNAGSTEERRKTPLVSSMFNQHPSLEKKKGSMDYGVYCIAVCVFLLHRKHMNFSQSLLHPKLI